eukprot:1557953-Amphidinium_carterae.1
MSAFEDRLALPCECGVQVSDMQDSHVQQRAELQRLEQEQQSSPKFIGPPPLCPLFAAFVSQPAHRICNGCGLDV